MASWDDGYLTDAGYPNFFNREITPAWLAMTALLLGHPPPDLSRPFRYADLGCGKGVTDVAIAAACPEAEVWGFDFNPAFIESARRLAAQAGLVNATFVETSFADLVRRADAELPEFDFIVCHGVLSWISPENRRRVIEVIGRRLRPGALAYLGYNTMTGWSSMIPIRALMRLLLSAGPQRSDLAVSDILDFLDRINEAGAQYFRNHPMLERHLKSIRDRDARYVAHEYLNEEWHPLMFADIADEMAEVKCTFIGSATLSDNIEAFSTPATFVPLLMEAEDIYLKETLRDLGCAQTFRRDLYRRGVTPLLPREQRALAEAQTIVGLGMPIQDAITVGTRSGTVTVPPDLYRPLLEMLETKPVSIGEAQNLAAFANLPLNEVAQAVAMLVTGGYALPRLAKDPTAVAKRSARALNTAIAKANALGDDIAWLVAPAVGGAVPASVIEVFVVGAILEGGPPEIGNLTDHVLSQLQHSGRQTANAEGQAVTDPKEAQRVIAEAVQNTLDRRARAFRQLDILDH